MKLLIFLLMILATNPVNGEVKWTFDDVKIGSNTEIDTTSLELQSPEQINRGLSPNSNIEPLSLFEKKKNLAIGWLNIVNQPLKKLKPRLIPSPQIAC